MSPAKGNGHDRSTSRPSLNDFFLSGEGINREVLQREIQKYLGPEATSRPSIYNVRVPKVFMCGCVVISDTIFRVSTALLFELLGHSLL